jgi:hypothetical protein
VETITITVSMYDRSRRAEVTLPDSITVAELMEQCANRWSLPAYTFVFRYVGSDELLLENESLRLAGVRDGAELQIFPIVEGG